MCGWNQSREDLSLGGRHQPFVWRHCTYIHNPDFFRNPLQRLGRPLPTSKCLALHPRRCSFDFRKRRLVGIRMVGSKVRPFWSCQQDTFSPFLRRLVDNDLQNELVTPYYTLSDHTLPITDIVCSFGIFPTNRVLTSSLDHSVKVWDLSTQTLLSTFQFPKAIATVTWDVAERIFFAASVDGSIHQVNLFTQREDRFATAVGGGGAADQIRIGDGPGSTGPTHKRLISVG